jgi:hypothetical protein
MPYINDIYKIIHILKMWPVNLILALSNLYGMSAVLTTISRSHYLSAFIICNAMTASIFFHLSETKHRLPGIRPFSTYTKELLWYDRVSAFLAIFYFLPSLPLYLPELGYGILGLVCLGISELMSNPYLFLPFHLAWHLLAFHTVNRLVSLPY